MTIEQQRTGTSSRSILIYVYLLVVLTIVVTAAIAGTLVYHRFQTFRVENEASEYHLATSLIVSRIEYELEGIRRNIESELSEARVDDVSDRSRREMAQSSFIIGRHLKTIEATQRQFSQPDFDMSTQRLSSAMERVDKLIATPANEPLTSESFWDAIYDTRIRCKQLRSLHMIAFSEKKSIVRDRSGWSSFAGWMAILFSTGCLSILLLLGLARRAVRRRDELEKALSRRALEAGLLYQAVAMADETNSLDAALQKCVDIVCEMTAWPLGHAYVISPSGGQQLESTKIWRFTDEQRFAKFREVTERTRFVMGEGLPGRVWKSGEPDWIVNVQQDDNFPRNRLRDDLGVRGGFGFPVKVRGETVAILEFYNEREVEKNETLLLLVRSVGEQVGRVIERIEAAEASRKHHELVAEELEKAKGELVLRTRLAAVGQMSAQIAHEMRNPLGAVSNAVFYLKRRVPASEKKWSEYLSLIDGEVATCNRFIGDLLDVTRGKVPNLATTNLANLIDRVLSRHSIPQSVEVQVVCQPNPFDIFADGDQVVQVIDNLFKNSLDAIGEQEGRIEIRARRSGGNDTITVHDTGTGIEPEYRVSVFDVLFSTKPTGTGLGLPICKQIIERHGGTIELVDESSPGTKFLVCLKHDPKRS